MIINPKKLKSWDTICVIAPAGTMKVVTKAVIEKAESFFKKFGIHVVYGRYVNEDWYGSGGTIEQRVEDLMNAFIDPNIQAIIPIFWGNSSNQLLPYIDYELIKKHPKIFVGYSDITALNLAIYHKSNLVTFCGPSFADFWQSFPVEYSNHHFIHTLIEWFDEINIHPSYKCMDEKWFLDITKKPVISENPWWKVHISWNAHGTVIGGNISTINLLMGTEYLPDFTNKIVFLEECHEFSYATIDRMLTQIQQTKILDNAKAVIFWRFQTDVQYPDLKPYKELIERITRDLRVPIISEFDFWHTYPMITLPIGRKCKIDTDQKNITFFK